MNAGFGSTLLEVKQRVIMSGKVMTMVMRTREVGVDTGFLG